MAAKSLSPIYTKEVCRVTVSLARKRIYARSLTPPEKSFIDLPIAEFEAETQPQIIATSSTERLGVYLDTAEQISGL
jgi:hypothetical protein